MVDFPVGRRPRNSRHARRRQQTNASATSQTDGIGPPIDCGGGADLEKGQALARQVE
jgi:hypothetical protein